MLIDRIMGLPAQASAHAAELDMITFLVHVLMFALFFGWGSYFIWALVRFRRGRNPRAQYNPVKTRASTYTEAGIVLAELILLVGFSIPAWATRVRDLPPEGEAVVIRVVSEQFAWNMHYPGADGEFGRTDAKLVAPENPVGLDRRSHHAEDDVVTTGEMVVPLGRPVIVQLSAKDVIHSFGVPVMRVKQDAIPGMMIPVWFTPTVVGEYEIVCSQLCGLGHYRMRGVLRVLEDADYRAWLVEQTELRN
jgi:cytochrome c oxidase subunit II